MKILKNVAAGGCKDLLYSTATHQTHRQHSKRSRSKNINELVSKNHNKSQKISKNINELVSKNHNHTILVTLMTKFFYQNLFRNLYILWIQNWMRRFTIWDTKLDERLFHQRYKKTNLYGKSNISEIGAPGFISATTKILHPKLTKREFDVIFQGRSIIQMDIQSAEINSMCEDP